MFSREFSKISETLFFIEHFRWLRLTFSLRFFADEILEEVFNPLTPSVQKKVIHTYYV